MSLSRRARWFRQAGIKTIAPAELEPDAPDAPVALVVHTVAEPLLSHRYPDRAAVERLVTHLHSLGPRPIGELLDDLARRLDIAAEIRTSLEAYCRLTPEQVRALKADCWPSPPTRAVQQ